MQKFSKHIAILTIALFTCFSNIYAQISNQIKAFLNQHQHYSEQMSENMIPRNGNLIVQRGSDSFFNPNGTQFLFKIKHGKIERLDQCQLHGFNFNRFLFEFENNIYTLGGYGFYRNTDVLQKFNFQTAEWDLIPLKENLSDDGILGFTYKSKNTVFSFVNIKPGNGSVQDIQENSPIAIDLKTMSCSKVNCDTALLNLIQYNKEFKQIYLSDFFVFKSLLKTIVIHTPSNQFIIVPNNMYKLWSMDKQELLFNGNIVSFSNQSIVDPSKYVSIDFESIWNDNIFNKKPVLTAIDENKLTTINYGWLVLVSLSLLGILGGIKFSRKSKKSTFEKEAGNNTSNFTSDHNYPFLEKLKQISPCNLSTDQLDSLLDISHMELNSRKTKRNRIIDKINNRYPDSISRERDGNDRRIIIYRINLPV